MTPKKTVTIQEESLLIDALERCLPGYKKTTIRNMLKHGAVSVNGQTTNRANHPLATGDEVEISFEQRSTRGREERIPFEIVYQDEAIILINKPVGLVSVPTLRKDEISAYLLLNEYLKTAKQRERAYIVHRIDRETSGLLLFAKSDELKHALKDNWKRTEKIYLAVTEGVPAKREGTLTSYLAEDRSLFVSSVRESEEAQLAITHYKVVRSSKARALLEIGLETGRKNQIRVHLSELGHPVVGDTKYGAQSNPVRRLALHAWRLSLDHPVTGERMNIEAPFPPELDRLVP